MQDVQRLSSAEELDASEERTRVPVDATLQVLYPINDYEMYKIICRRLLCVLSRLLKALANATRDLARAFLLERQLAR